MAVNAPKVIFSDVENKIYNGDMLMFNRGDGIFSKLIAIAGRTDKSHVGMAVRLTEKHCKEFAYKYPTLTPGLYCAHMLSHKGGALDKLEKLVCNKPGQITVKKPSKRYNRLKARDAMLKMVKQEYGWLGIFKNLLLHLPFARIIVYSKLIPKILNDNNGSEQPFCSMAFSRAAKEGGIDPVDNLSDTFTDPGDLDRSPLFKAAFTLFPNSHCYDIDIYDRSMVALIEDLK